MVIRESHYSETQGFNVPLAHEVPFRKAIVDRSIDFYYQTSFCTIEVHYEASE